MVNSYRFLKPKRGIGHWARTGEDIVGRLCLFAPGASAALRQDHGKVMATNILSFISNIPLFKGLPQAQLERLARIATSKPLNKGEAVFSEGAEADGFYVIVRGRVKIFKLSPDGKEQVLHIVGFSEPFGEVPVFSGGRFPANAQTIEDALLIFFPRSAFVDLIRTDPSLALNMLALLSRRLMHFASLIEGLSLKEVPHRLAAYLLYLNKKSEGSDVVDLEISKTLLANVLGTIPETVSRVLGKMTAEGIIDVDGRRIRILDRRRLHALSSGTVAL
jgi:CRP/FNR family transcriptional regulator, dissimilatory nitrate respiration regulator